MRKKQESTEKLICPVCSKEFVATDDTKYKIGKDYTCSWRCFLNYVKSHPKKEKENKNVKK